jgi:hypothetical protein
MSGQDPESDKLADVFTEAAAAQVEASYISAGKGPGYGKRFLEHHRERERKLRESMKVVRTITYETDDPETLKRQIQKSLRPGVHKYGHHITITVVDVVVPDGVMGESEGWYREKAEAAVAGLPAEDQTPEGPSHG